MEFSNVPYSSEFIRRFLVFINILYGVYYCKFKFFRYCQMTWEFRSFHPYIREDVYGGEECNGSKRYLGYQKQNLLQS